MPKLKPLKPFIDIGLITLYIHICCMNYNSYYSPMDPISLSFYGPAKKNILHIKKLHIDSNYYPEGEKIIKITVCLR